MSEPTSEVSSGEGSGTTPDSPQRFSKVLRSREVITLAFGAMIGWSWVLMTGLWVEVAGSMGTLIAFAGGGLAIALIGLTYSELVSAMPRAGGEHVYTHRGLGAGWSFFCTWALLLAYVNVCLFEAVALPTAMEYLTPDIRIGTPSSKRRRKMSAIFCSGTTFCASRTRSP